MIDKALYAIVGAVVGMLLFGILRPDGVFPDYDRIIVHEIKGEPDTVRTFVDRIVYRDRQPEVVVTQPGGGIEIVEQFCRDTLVITATDTVVVRVTPTFLMRSVATDAGWFWQKDRVRLYGPVNTTGDLLEIRYVTWPGWRALRTRQYTYARTVKGPWLLFDIAKDPYQTNNLVSDPESQTLVEEMDNRLATIMKETGDSWDIKSTTGDIKNWLPGGSKQKSQNLGVPWPDGQVEATKEESGGGRKRKKGGRRKVDSTAADNGE